MSALDVLNICLDEIGITKSAPELSTTTDTDVIELRTFMNLSGQDIARRADFSRLLVEETTSGSITEHTKPASFSRLPSNGGTVKLNKSSFIPVVPVTDDAVWALTKYKTPTSLYYYHQSGDKILFSPTLDSDGAVICYVSKYWVENATTGREDIRDNGDTILIPEKLVAKGAIWRWMRKKGLPYEDYIAEFEADLQTELMSNRGGI